MLLEQLQLCIVVLQSGDNYQKQTHILHDVKVGNDTDDLTYAMQGNGSKDKIEVFQCITAIVNTC